jgi:cobalamin biosynthesis protein CobD/CbiB
VRTIPSVAENASDAAVGALFWGAVAGLPGLVGYRAVNTLDATVGHSSARYARYARFGTATARLDDKCESRRRDMVRSSYRQNSISPFSYSAW